MRNSPYLDSPIRSESEARHDRERAAFMRRRAPAADAPPRILRGLAYWPAYEAARHARRLVETAHPEAREVYYLTGWAVQLRRSGDYVGTHNAAALGVPL